MGTWHGPTVEESLYRILDEVDPNYMMLRSRTDVIDALVASGLVVRTDFYVPDPGELYDLMRRWSFHMAGGMQGGRWVMCEETVNVLVRREKDRLMPRPASVGFGFAADSDGAGLPTLGMEAVRVVESPSRWFEHYRLFGFPIRIDPAARSPLFEIDTPSTTRKGRP